MRLFPIFIFFVIITTGCTISHFDRGYLIPASEQPVEISFETVSDMLFLEAEINGVQGRFLFDNGYSLSAINQQFAERAGIQFASSSNLVDANNKSSKTKETTVDSVQIGGHTFVQTGFYLVNTLNFLPCTEIDGIIGASIINKINWEIDFEENKMKLSSIPFIESGTPVSLKYSVNNSAFVPLTVRGERFNCKLDFGSNSSIKLNKNNAPQLFANEQVEKRIGVTSFSANGMAKIDTFYTVSSKSEVAFGKQDLQVNAKIHLYNNLKYEGYVGTEYLKEYKVVLNSTISELVLSHRPDTIPDIPDKSYGLVLYSVGGKWKIIQLNPNEPDLDATLLMQVVTMLDGEPVERFDDICEYRKYIRDKMQKEEVLSIVLEGSNSALELPYDRPEVEMLN